ncbi:MAG: DUF488 domain-containing protein [Chitinophagaceae bacterium]|nr:DUF488 domain-containing protein [Chitinophagaceae bacterium]
MPVVQIKRIYEPEEDADGFRVLVDRLWPRGIKKENAHIDIWLKEVAPSTALRKWFNHDPEKWEDFQKKYTAELKESEAAKELAGIVKKHRKTTFLYSAHDALHNQAQVLQHYITGIVK